MSEEKVLRKEYERGYADAMNWKTQNHLEHLPPARSITLYKKEWVELTPEEVVTWANKEKDPTSFARGAAWANARLKEKNT